VRFSRSYKALGVAAGDRLRVRTIDSATNTLRLERSDCPATFT
jgi:hypothetical protein